MSHGPIAGLFFLLTGAFGWMIVADFRSGNAELPRTGWRVDRRFDPALFWTFTTFNVLILSVMLFAAARVLLA